MKSQRILFFLMLTIITVVACKKKSTTYDCTGITPTYTADIKTIMDNNCSTTGCHSASSQAAGKDYSSYTSVKNGANSDSFMGSLQHLNGYTAMPKNKSKLSDAQLKSIYCWIQNGMPQ